VNIKILACQIIGPAAAGSAGPVPTALSHDREVVGSTPGRVAIEWLVPGWVTVCGQVNHLGI